MERVASTSVRMTFACAMATVRENITARHFITCTPAFLSALNNSGSTDDAVTNFYIGWHRNAANQLYLHIYRYIRIPYNVRSCVCVVVSGRV